MTLYYLIEYVYCEKKKKWNQIKREKRMAIGCKNFILIDKQ